MPSASNEPDFLLGDEVDVDDVLPYYGVCWKTYHIYLSYSLREWGAVNLRPILDKLYTSDFDVRSLHTCAVVLPAGVLLLKRKSDLFVLAEQGGRRACHAEHFAALAGGL